MYMYLVIIFCRTSFSEYSDRPASVDPVGYLFLQSRLRQHTQQLSGWSGGAPVAPPGESELNASFVSRYQRLAGERQDVFSGQLPGTSGGGVRQQIYCQCV